MYEVWYRKDDTPYVILYAEKKDAVKQAVKLFRSKDAVFDFLVFDGGVIRNDLVIAAADDARRKDRKDQAESEGTPWVVEVKADHKFDFWAVSSEFPDEAGADTAAETIAGLLGPERVRVRQL